MSERFAGAESYLTPLYKLIKSSGLYAIASMASPLVFLLLAPFLTNHLSLSEYGILTILNTFMSLVAGITQLGLGAAFFRAYGYDYTSQQDRRDVLATVTMLLCLVSIPTAIGMALLAPFLAKIFFGEAALSGLFTLVGGIVLLQNLTVPSFAWLRAENRALFYSLLAISNVLIILIVTIVLVGMLHLGVVGALIATGCGYASVLICMMPIILLRAGMRIRADIARGVLAFGLPLVFNVVAYWVLQLSDRYLLSLFGSPAQTAKYSVVYMLGSAIAVVVIGPFILAWPTALFAIAKREDAAEVFRFVFRWFGMFLLFVAFGLSLVGTVLLDWLFPVTYHSEGLIIPIIAESIVLYGIYYMFTVGVNIKRKTWCISIFMTVAAIVNVALNLVLIPRYGAMGAAISTLLAYAVLVIVAYIVNQRVYPISFEIGKFIIALLVGSVLYIGSSMLAHWGISFGTLCLYGGFLVVLGKLSQGDRKGKVSVCMHVLSSARSDGRVMREAAALVEAGFAVSIVDVECERRPAEETIRGICMKHIIMLSWYTSRRFELWFFINVVQMLIVSVQRLMQTGADVYHAHDVQALPACWIAARLRGKPLIFDSHELPLPETKIVFWRRLQGLLTHFLAWILPRCAGVITVSIPIAQEMRRRYHCAVVTLIRNVPLYQAVTRSDRLRQHLGLGPDVRLALYQGYLQADRRLDKLVQAAPFLDSDIVIVLMGQNAGTTQEDLTTLIAREGVAERVKIIPPVPYEELLDWTSSADIGLIVYSVSLSLNVQMCLPNKLFEYLMAGLPVLTSELDAVVEVVRTYEVGHIVSSLAPADVGAAINAMVADPVALAHMRRNALEVAQREFCWERESTQLIRLYQDILARPDASHGT